MEKEEEEEKHHLDTAGQAGQGAVQRTDGRQGGRVLQPARNLQAELDAVKAAVNRV